MVRPSSFVAQIVFADYGTALLFSGSLADAYGAHLELVQLMPGVVLGKAKKHALARFDRFRIAVRRILSPHISYNIHSTSITLTRELHLLSPVRYAIVLARRLQDEAISLLESGSISNALRISAECIKVTRGLQKLDPAKHVAHAASWREGGHRHSPSLTSGDAGSRPTRGVLSHQSIDPANQATFVVPRLLIYGFCLEQCGSLSEACKINQEAVEWALQFHLLYPERRSNSVTVSLGHWGRSLIASGSYQAAQHVLSISVTIARENFIIDPNGHATELARGLTDYSGSLCGCGSYQEACETGLDSVNVARVLCLHDPDKHAKFLAPTLSSYGAALHKYGLYREACEARFELVAIKRELHRLHPDQRSEKGLLGGLHDYATSLFVSGSYPAASEVLAELVAMIRKSYALAPDFYATGLAHLLYFRGMSVHNTGIYGMARALFSESVELYRQLCGGVPGEYKRQLARSETAYHLSASAGLGGRC